MNVYPPYMQRQQTKKNELILDKVSLLLSGFMLMLLIAVVCHSCVEAVVKTVENEEEFKRPVYVEQSYRQPAAFRKASPTMNEMDHLEALLTVQEVAR